MSILLGGGLEKADFGPELAVGRVGPEGLEMGVAGEMVEIAVTESQSVVESLNGVGEAVGEAVAAGEVVKDGGVVGTETGQLEVDLQPIGGAPPAGVIVSQQTQRVHEIGGFLNEALQEPNLDVQTLLLAS